MIVYRSVQQGNQKYPFLRLSQLILSGKGAGKNLLRIRHLKARLLPKFPIRKPPKTAIECLILLLLIGVMGLPLESRAADTSKAREILARSSFVASSVERIRGRDNLLSSIIMSQIAIKDIAGALRSITFMDLNKDMSLAQVVKLQAESGDLAGARATASAMQSEINKANALSDIAIAEAKTGDFERALKTLSTIKDESAGHLNAKKGIATIQGKTGDIQGALKTALEVMDSRPDALWDIVIPMAKAGDVKGAKQIISNVQNEYHRGYALWGVVRGQLNGDLEGAIQTANSIETSHAKASALAEIARFQLNKGDIAGALQNLDAAAEAAGSVGNIWAKADILWQIAAAQAQSGDFKSSLKTATSIPAGSHREAALKDIIVAQARSGDRNGALQTASKFGVKNDSTLMDLAFSNIGEKEAAAGNIQGAMAAIAKIEEKDARSIAMMRVVNIQAEGGDIKGALESISKIPKGTHQDRATQSVVEAQARSGEIEGALQTVTTIQDEFRRGDALIALAESQAIKGNTKEALAWATMRKDPLEQAYALLGIAQGILKRETLDFAK